MAEFQARPEYQLPDRGADEDQNRGHAPTLARAGEFGKIAGPDPAGLRPHGRHDHRLFRRRLCLFPPVRCPLRSVAMLETIHLTKRYEDGQLALDDLTFKVEPGEIFC